MTRPQKKRSVKRGKKPSTLTVSTPHKVTFVDEQPPDRFNLAFFADYSDRDAALEASDEAFLHLYHEAFPNALDSSTVWATKPPGSRSHCKADVIKKVPSILDILTELYNFVSFQEGKKLGTIVLSGHGTPTEFALPLTEGGKRIPLDILEVGLKHVDVLDKGKPAEWKWSNPSWDEFRGDLLKLQVRAEMLHRRFARQDWIDEKTLIRMWCCNLGKPPKGDKDPLKIFGKLLLGDGKFMIEAPKNKSGNQVFTFSEPDSADQALAKIFRNEKGRVWHPDTVSEVESDSKLMSYTGEDLRAPQAEFVRIALQSPPPPSGRRRDQWIPACYVEDDARKNIFPSDWEKFRNLWRRESLG